MSVYCNETDECEQTDGTFHVKSQFWKMQKNQANATVCQFVCSMLPQKCALIQRISLHINGFGVRHPF